MLDMKEVWFQALFCCQYPVAETQQSLRKNFEVVKTISCLHLQWKSFEIMKFINKNDSAVAAIIALYLALFNIRWDVIYFHACSLFSLLI